MLPHQILGTIASGRTTEILKGLMTHPYGLGSEIAIKRLRPEFVEEPEVLRAFLNEARVGIALKHDNIVGVILAGSSSGQPEIVMQYLNGWNLAAIFKSTQASGGALDFDVAVALCHGLACGVAHVHEVGLVHRHITPGNVMLTTTGCVKLLDFGGAIHGYRRPASRYTAPEFFLSHTPLDERGDIYAVGAILHELTTGRVLFGAERGAGEEIVRGNVPSPMVLRRDYPEALCKIVERCMALEPEHRYPDMEAVLEALEEVAVAFGSTLSTRVLRGFAQLDLEQPQRRRLGSEAGEITTPPLTENMIHRKPDTMLTPIDLPILGGSYLTPVS